MEYIDLNLPSHKKLAVTDGPIKEEDICSYNLATIDDVIELQSNTTQSLYKGQIRMKGSNGNILAVQAKKPYRICSPQKSMIAVWKKKGNVFRVEWNEVDVSMEIPCMIIKM